MISSVQMVLTTLHKYSYYYCVVLTWFTDKTFGVNVCPDGAMISYFSFRHLFKHFVLQQLYESDMWPWHVAIKLVTTDSCLSLKPIYMTPRKNFSIKFN